MATSGHGRARWPGLLRCRSGPALEGRIASVSCTRYTFHWPRDRGHRHVRIGPAKCWYTGTVNSDRVYEILAQASDHAPQDTRGPVYVHDIFESAQRALAR